jgi:DUF4097 and DUF4098 domain-containing protein YvlB
MTKMDRTTHRTIRWICSLAAALLVVSCSNVEHWGPKVRRERQVELSASMQAGSALRVNIRNGPISVQGTDADGCHLTAKIQVHAASKEKAQEFAEAIQLRLQQTSDGLEVITDAPPTGGVGEYSVSLTLSVPRRTSLKLTTGEGELRISNIEGSIEAVTSNGDVQVENIKGDLRLKSYDGAITCMQVGAGAVDLYTTHGDARLSQAKATTCAIESADGLAYAADVQAESMNFRTTSGGIRCQNVAAKKLNCSSSDGSVYITWAPNAPKSPDVTVALTDGSITFVGVAEMSAVLDAFTNSGPIRAKIPGIADGRLDKSLKATLGAGGGRLVFTTHDGSITIR